MSTLLSELRYATRSLLKTPGLTSAAILSLGLGIGANTTIFTWVQAVLFRPIPMAAQPDRILIPAIENREGQSRSWSYPNYKDFRGRTTLLDIVVQDDQTFSVVVDGVADRTWGGLVSGNYFQFMGLTPAAGRVFSQDDDVTPGGHPLVVLSHAYWKRRFAGDSGVVGKQVTINTVPFTIIGVAPEGFIGSFLGIAASAWVPMAMHRDITGTDRLNARGSSSMQALAKRRPGVSRAQAQAEASSIMSQLAAEFPETNDGRRLRLVQTWEAPFGAPSVLAPILAVMSVLVALVLVIACANVANLLLSKAVGRRREIAVRLSLGASRSRLVRQLLTESLLLAAVAGAMGIAMAYWAMDLLMAFVPPVDVPIDLGVTMDQTTLLFALVVSGATGLVFGLAPALQAVRREVNNALNEEGNRGSGGRTGRRLRNALVVVQVAVCLVLLVGAALFLRSFVQAQTLSPGFDPNHMVTASVDLFPSGYTGDRNRDFQRRAMEALEAVPGVRSAAFASRVPLGLDANDSTSVAIDGYAPRKDEEITISYTIVGPRYFETMGIPIRQGREYGRDDTAHSPPVIVVNDSMAKRYWPQGNALGGRVRRGQVWFEVVGIAGDTKYSSISERSTPQIYLSLARSEVSMLRLAVRAEGDPGPVVAEVRNAIRAIDTDLPVFDARTVNEHMQTAVFAQGLAANLLGAMGVLALCLAAIGLYAVMAHAVSQRTQEMGIRLALGASPRSLLGMVVGQGMKLGTAGLAIGLVIALGAFGSIGVMRSLLPGISPLDPLTFVAVPAVLGLITLLASWIPARRAARVDPLEALRYE